MGYPVDREKLYTRTRFVLFVAGLLYIFPSAVVTFDSISKYFSNCSDFLPEWKPVFRAYTASQIAALTIGLALIRIFIVASKAAKEKRLDLMNLCMKIVFIFAVIIVGIFAAIVFILSSPKYQKEVDDMVKIVDAHDICKNEEIRIRKWKNFPWLQLHPQPFETGGYYGNVDEKCKVPDDVKKMKEFLRLKRIAEFLLMSQCFLAALMEVWIVIAVYKIKNAPEVLLQSEDDALDDTPGPDGIASTEL